jgi:hypothetical protein
MKPFFTRIRNILLTLFFPAILLAQGSTDYNILLKSGTFLPDQNISRVVKSDEVFQKSLFNNRHYVTIQFYSLPDEAMKNSLRAAGIELMDYIPHKAYTAAVRADFSLETFKSFPLRSVFMFTAGQKTIPEVLRGEIPAHALYRGGYADLNIITYETIHTAALIPVLNSMEAILLEEMPAFRTYTIRIAKENIKYLAGASFVQWVEPIDPPNRIENLPGRTLHRVNVLNDGVRNLKGDNINIGIWDGGQVNLNHQDFLPAGRVTIVRAGGVSDHATHVAGTITGKGLVNRTAQGMAPNATLFSWDFNTNVQTEMATAIPTYNLLVSSHSYGSTGAPTCNLTDPLLAYSTAARNNDINFNNNPSHLHVHSSGNSGSSCSGGFLTITGSGKPAKNNLVVANITSLEAISGSSSSGPVHDGRIKPEISAMGTSVFSTWIPNSSYATISGTSMATPGVSGTAALLHQRYRQLNSNNNAPSTLIKNIICNGAEDLGNPGPDYRYGFGRINALKAVKILEENRYALNTISQGGINDITVNVPAGTALLKVMLTWNDPAGAANAAIALVNDLDLEVIEGSNTTLPWILNKNTPSAAATRGLDIISNIEQVTIDNPPAGTYTLRVKGTNIGSGPSQQYALTWSVEAPYIEVTYPNGNENLSPGTSEVITWDKLGITSNQTVEYSLNNGSTWTTISTTVAPNISRLTWSVPTTNTSTALIRISQGAISDVSDATFKILNTPTGLSGSGATCAPGEVVFSWNAVTNATHYDIYRIDAGTGTIVLLAGNLTSSPHTATGLTPGASMWFAIVAKNNTTGSESPRSNAINVIVSTGSGGLGAIGSISGQNLVCGTATNVAYSIAPVTGATSYSWAVPPGAVIASGQGTSSILVNFPGGSSSGNVSVYASAGSCQTPTSTMSVTVSPAVDAPVSGGNQTHTVCPPDPVPTLTATATVPPGHTITWYNAPTGGSVIVSPTLNAVGTVTYYAESRDNSSNCISNTRTPVTLTIDQVPPATITASGPTSFCEGGSVTLTANAGTSYSWSTGATTQSINITASGTYSVTVNQPGGCVTNSQDVTVTVHVAPPAGITASGPTTFCDGENVVLTASSGASYSWSNGASTPSITVSAAGNYTVTITQANGCSRTSTPTSVTVNPKPVVTLTASPYTKLLPGRSTTLTATITPPGTVTYSWMLNGTTVAGATGSSVPVTLSELGNYSVSVVNAFGCGSTSNTVTISDSATTKLFIYPNPNRGEFTVSYHNRGTISSYIITIYDAIGRQVWNRTYGINNPYELIPIDLKKNGRGVYQVVVSDRNGAKLASGAVVLQ